MIIIRCYNIVHMIFHMIFNLLIAGMSRRKYCKDVDLIDNHNVDILSLKVDLGRPKDMKITHEYYTVILHM